MSEAPERIWATELAQIAGIPGVLYGCAVGATLHEGHFAKALSMLEYIRADIHAARIAELERQLAHMAAMLDLLRGAPAPSMTVPDFSLGDVTIVEDGAQ